MKPNTAAMPGGHKDKPGNGADTLGTNSEIGRKLKQYYDGLVSEDVPDRFADLLKQLEEREGDDIRRDGE
jgi:hypothetical protein